MKTRTEVEELKRQWANDPCWDLGADEGFEEYWKELETFQADMERHWKEARRIGLLRKANQLGVPGNTKLAEEWELLEYKIEELKAKVYRLENAE